MLLVAIMWVALVGFGNVSIADVNASGDVSGIAYVGGLVGLLGDINTEAEDSTTPTMSVLVRVITKGFE